MPYLPPRVPLSCFHLPSSRSQFIFRLRIYGSRWRLPSCPRSGVHSQIRLGGSLQVIARGRADSHRRQFGRDPPPPPRNDCLDADLCICTDFWFSAGRRICTALERRWSLPSDVRSQAAVILAGWNVRMARSVRLRVHAYTSRLPFMNDIPPVHKSDFIAWHPPFNLMLYTDRRPGSKLTNQITRKTRTGSSQLDLTVLSAVLPQLVPGDIPIRSPRMMD